MATTWAHAACAIHTTARFVEASLSQGDKKNRSITAIGILPNASMFRSFQRSSRDLRLLHQLCSRSRRLHAGYHVFSINQRVSSEGLAHLVQTTRLQYLFVSDGIANQPESAASTDYSFCDTLYFQMPTFGQLIYEVAENFRPLPPPVYTIAALTFIHQMRFIIKVWFASHWYHPKAVHHPPPNLIRLLIRPFFSGVRDLVSHAQRSPSVHLNSSLH